MAGQISRRIAGALLLLGVQLSQVILGTTVIPLCGRNKTENCTTALVQTGNSPRMAKVQIIDCKSEMKNYCLNGQCIYVVELDQHSCRCDAGYVGVRCGHSTFELVQKPLSDEYLALTILSVLLFLVAISLAIYFLYKWYQNKKRRLTASKEYKEVATDTEKDNKLLHV
ncbi:proepiregulin [Pogona vitticeps]|uniref:Proepiregulin n=1 Tax=Pogona vitticeps TaxID=103695 RepID=A0A6J0U037_9SAUR